MVMMQIRLVPAYRRVPFGPGAWAYGFSYAAAVTVTVRWLAAADVGQQVALTYFSSHRDHPCHRCALRQNPPRSGSEHVLLTAVNKDVRVRTAAG